MTKVTNEKEIEWSLEAFSGVHISLQKRSYVPARLSMKCPNCGWELYRDFLDSYFSYPTTNEPYTVTIMCEEGPEGEEGCGEEFSVDLVVELSVRFASDEEEA